MKQSINCNVNIWSLEYWKGEDLSLLPNTTYSLLINYPFNKPANYPIKTGKNGLGLFGLLVKIGKAYDKKYASAKKDAGDGYWHAIEDLVIEGITVDHDQKTIQLNVGS